MNSAEIKSIIFDLGGVIIHIEEQRTFDGLQEIVGEAHQNVLSDLHADGLLLELELGTIPPFTFKRRLRQLTGFEGTEEELNEIWNRLLLGIPAANINLLRNLQQHTDLYLLSNTNALHMEWIKDHIREVHGLSAFTDIFREIYFSYDLNMRKPESRIFEHILEDRGLHPEETLFIDDSEEHIRTASSLGIQTHLHPKNTALDEIPYLNAILVK